MIELARTKDGLSFHVLEHSFELEKLKVGNFSYFQKHLGMTNYMANFKSWLKRPSVILLVAMSGKTIVGWCMNEKWTPPSQDGRPVHVLRAIEVSDDISRKGYGKIIFNLVSRFIPGHIITKPVNNNAKEFFKSLGFVSPDSNSAVSLMDYPGYALLEESDKPVDFSDDVNILNEGFENGYKKIFPGEYLPEAVVSEVMSDSDEASTANKSDACDKSVEEGQEPISGSLIDGQLKGKQKMMSPCKCGAYQTAKYLISDNREGTAYICLSCKEERYFLPLKKST